MECQAQAKYDFQRLLCRADTVNLSISKNPLTRIDVIDGFKCEGWGISIRPIVG